MKFMLHRLTVHDRAPITDVHAARHIAVKRSFAASEKFCPQEINFQIFCVVFVIPKKDVNIFY